MKRTLLILAAICFTITVHSQNYQTVEEVDDVCSQLGFSSDEEAQIAVDRILTEIGIPSKSFKLRSCPNINNAVAKNIKNEKGDYERYILYDINFMKRISDNAANDWSAISVLAHEIGHHLSGHSLNNQGSNHKFELEADYFSGVALAKMGATLNEAQSAIQTLRYEKETSTHPAKADRLIEIEKGWKTVSKNSSNTNLDDEDEAFNEVLNNSKSDFYNTDAVVPAPSPLNYYFKKLGDNTIVIKYSRITRRDRIMFGDVLPYGKLWRTGANENTIISFTEDLLLDGKKIKAGTYSIFSIPEKNSWTIFFYKTVDNWGTPENWEESNIVLQFNVNTSKTREIVESFQINIDELIDGEGFLIMSFENTEVKIPFATTGSSESNSPKTSMLQTVGLNAFQISFQDYLKKTANGIYTLADHFKTEDEITICGKTIVPGDYKLIAKKEDGNVLKFSLLQKIRSRNGNAQQTIFLCSREYNTSFDENSFYGANFGNFTNNSAELQLRLSSNIIKIPITVNTTEKVTEIVRSKIALNSMSSGDYSAAAKYYYDENLDINLAKQWIDKADELGKDKFWILLRQSLIYFKLGEKSAAIRIAKRSLELAKEAGNVDYQKLNERNLNEWQ